MKNSLGTFPINLSNNLMPNYGRIELFPDKLVLSDSIINTTQDDLGLTRTIELHRISNIRLKPWLLFNTKIVIDFPEGAVKKTISFSSRDTWSSNMFRTVYLYQAILDLRKMGTCDTSMLSKTLNQDKVPILFMFVGSIVGPIILVSLFGKEYSIIYMFIGSVLFGLPITYYCYIKVQKLISQVEQLV